MFFSCDQAPQAPQARHLTRIPRLAPLFGREPQVGRVRKGVPFIGVPVSETRAVTCGSSCSMKISGYSELPKGPIGPMHQSCLGVLMRPVLLKGLIACVK